ncbi:fibroleukin-like [Mytilus trossulus]|uniref:fibroleukin-like n=1 Tax=Mytilus trossulus TaxID=6551 RepID=UPI00300721D1
MDDVIPNRDCSDLPLGSKSGVNRIHPAEGNNISVFCDMETDNGGWTVIQRRFNGTTGFYRYWEDYKNGFGEISGEHWLGNDNIYLIVKHKAYTVRFDFEAFTGETAYAIYDTFNVLDETTNYTLHISDYSGTAEDVQGIVQTFDQSEPMLKFQPNRVSLLLESYSNLPPAVLRFSERDIPLVEGELSIDMSSFPAALKGKFK